MLEEETLNGTRGPEDAGDNGQSEGEIDPRLRSIEERLRRMEWPKPPPGTTERLFERFNAELETRRATETESEPNA